MTKQTYQAPLSEVLSIPVEEDILQVSFPGEGSNPINE